MGTATGRLRDQSAAVLAVTARRSCARGAADDPDVVAAAVDPATRAGRPDENGSFAEFLADGITDEQCSDRPVPRQHGLLGVLLRVRTRCGCGTFVHPQFDWWPSANPVLTDFLGSRSPTGTRSSRAVPANKNTPGGFQRRGRGAAAACRGTPPSPSSTRGCTSAAAKLSIVAERNRNRRELHDAVPEAVLPAADRARRRPWSTVIRRGRPSSSATCAVGRRVSDELRAVVVGLLPVDLSGDVWTPPCAKQARAAQTGSTRPPWCSSAARCRS